MADAPDNAFYLLSADERTLKNAKVLRTDDNFYTVSTIDETKLFFNKNLAAIDNIASDQMVSIRTQRLPLNPAGFQIRGSDTIAVSNGAGTGAGEIVIDVNNFTTNQMVNVLKDGQLIKTSGELNFQPNPLLDFSVSGNTSQIFVQPTLEDGVQIATLEGATDLSSFNVINFTANGVAGVTTFTLGANLTGATSGQCMVVDDTGEVKWTTPDEGLKSLELSILPATQDILSISATPGGSLVSAGTDATITLELLPPEPAAQKFVRWDATAEKYIYADLVGSDIQSIGMTIEPASAAVLEQSTATLTGPGAFSLGFTGGVAGNVAVFNQTTSLMEWKDALKSMDVTIGADSLLSLKNFTVAPITTTGSIELGFVTDGVANNSVLAFNSTTNEVAPVSPSNITSVGISSSGSAELITSGGPVTTTGTIQVGFDPTGTSNGNILMNTGTTMGWVADANTGNAGLPRVVFSGYGIIDINFTTPPDARTGFAFNVVLGPGYVLERFFGVGFPSSNYANTAAKYNNLAVTFGSYDGNTLSGFVVAFNPPDNQGDLDNLGRGAEYIIYYMPA